MLEILKIFITKKGCRTMVDLYCALLDIIIFTCVYRNDMVYYKRCDNEMVLCYR